MNTKFGQCNLKPFVTLNCEDLEFSLKGVSVAAWQTSKFRHEKLSCYNSGIQCPICIKIHMFDESPVLNTWPWPYSVIVRAPPAGNRKWNVLHSNEILIEIYIQCLICPKLHMLDKARNTPSQRRRTSGDKSRLRGQLTSAASGSKVALTHQADARHPTPNILL